MTPVKATRNMAHSQGCGQGAGQRAMMGDSNAFPRWGLFPRAFHVVVLRPHPGTGPVEARAAVPDRRPPARVPPHARNRPRARARVRPMTSAPPRPGASSAARTRSSVLVKIGSAPANPRSRAAAASSSRCAAVADVAGRARLPARATRGRSPARRNCALSRRCDFCEYGVPKRRYARNERADCGNMSL
jgi:hypothetical protein